jgi:hypothetical protein
MLKNTLFYLDVNDTGKIKEKIELLEGTLSSSFDYKKLTHVVTNRLLDGKIRVISFSHFLGVNYTDPVTEKMWVVKKNEESPPLPGAVRMLNLSC